MGDALSFSLHIWRNGRRVVRQCGPMRLPRGSPAPMLYNKERNGETVAATLTCALYPGTRLDGQLAVTVVVELLNEPCQGGHTGSSPLTRSAVAQGLGALAQAADKADTRALVATPSAVSACLHIVGSDATDPTTLDTPLMVSSNATEYASAAYHAVKALHAMLVTTGHRRSSRLFCRGRHCQAVARLCGGWGERKCHGRSRGHGYVRKRGQLIATVGRGPKALDCNGR